MGRFSRFVRPVPFGVEDMGVSSSAKSVFGIVLKLVVRCALSPAGFKTGVRRAVGWAVALGRGGLGKRVFVGSKDRRQARPVWRMCAPPSVALNV